MLGGGASPGAMKGGDGLGGIWGGAPQGSSSVSTGQPGSGPDLGLGSLSLRGLGSGSMSTDSGLGGDGGFTLSGFDTLKSLNLDGEKDKPAKTGGGSASGLWGGGGGGSGGLGGGIW